MSRPTVYMAGPITNAEGGGYGWRERVASNHPQIEWHNPLDQYDAHASELDVIHTEARVDDGTRVSTRSIVAYDKRLIRGSDAVLVNWPGVQSDGTAMEVCYAEMLDVPVIVRADEELSIWMYDHTTTTRQTFDEAVLALEALTIDRTGDSDE